ncbi:MAG: SdpI family protein [Oscillospiraceae bacterium]
MTKYSLSSDEAWHKTQRYAGRVMLCAGGAAADIDHPDGVRRSGHSRRACCHGVELHSRCSL